MDRVVLDASPAVPVGAAAVPDLPEIQLSDRLHTGRHLLLWQVRGWSDLRVEDRWHKVPPEQLFWIPAGTPHGIVVEPAAFVLPTFFCTDIAEVGESLGRPVCVPLSPALAATLPVLVQAQHTALQPEIDLRPAVLAMLDEAARIADAELMLPVAPAARQIASALLEHPGDRRSLAQWAVRCHVSPRAVERAFRAETGLTFSHWRQRNRMQHAVALLRAGRPVSEVARRVGYLDHSAFSRAFRDQFEVEPSAYRQEPAAVVGASD